MPRCGSHIVNCDTPIYFDTYTGCDYACTYCNERVKGRGKDLPKPDEGVRAVRNFIEGDRTWGLEWCDWDIPLHWGVCSEPFQDCEREHQRSYKLLRLFAETGYPVIVSTKSVMPGEPGLLDILRDCNVVIQLSMTSPVYEVWEPGAPGFYKRLELIPNLVSVSHRVLIRVQPYTFEVLRDVMTMLPYYRDLGVYGVMVEGMKKRRSEGDFTERYGQSAVYPLDRLFPHFYSIRSGCHGNGLKFFCAENRLRYMGDSPNCCGYDGIDGWAGNFANSNHEGDFYTDRMKEPDTGRVFCKSYGGSEERKRFQGMSYMDAMEEVLPPEYKILKTDN